MEQVKGGAKKSKPNACGRAGQGESRESVEPGGDGLDWADGSGGAGGTGRILRPSQGLIYLRGAM